MKHFSMKFLVTIVLVCLMSSVYGQNENDNKLKLNKNAVYGTIGTLVIYYIATMYYERMITQKKYISSFAKVGYGGYVGWLVGEGEYVLAQYGILLGSKTHHLEASAGMSYINEAENVEITPISATLGYRIQKPKGHFIFRMGASWPEAAYIGIGVSF